MRRLILASASPRRKELLEMMGYEFEVKVSEAQECTRETMPEKVVKELSRIKAVAVAEEVMKNSRASKAENDECIVIGADTIVVLDGEILGKPKDEEDAFGMLKKLQGRAHEVYTGVTIISEKSEEMSFDLFNCRTIVNVNPMTDEQIRQYIATGEPMDKAGAYGIQGIFSRHIRGIEGDYYNVVGLPVSMIYDKLEQI